MGIRFIGEFIVDMGYHTAVKLDGVGIGFDMDRFTVDGDICINRAN